MKYKNYLFDLDGTLIDSAQSIIEAFQRAEFAVFNRNEMSKDIIRSWIGLPLSSTLLQFPENERKILEQEYIKANDDLQKNGVPFFDGMQDVLIALKKSGVRLAVVSNKRKAAIEHWAAVMGVRGLFECIVGREDTAKNKPDAEPVIFCLGLINGNRKETIYIGDTIHDLECAKAAGVAFAAVDWTCMDKARLKSAKPDYWLINPDDLLTLS